MSKRIWVTWETQRRNRTLSKEVGAELFEFDLKGNKIRRYLRCVGKTIRTFLRERPTIIFVQNPSLMLAALAVHYGRWMGIPVVVDAHYAGLFPFEGRHPWANKLTARIIRMACITIVTNQNSKSYVEQIGGTGYVLTDPIPQFQHQLHLQRVLKGKYNVLFICTYAADEPYMEVIKASKDLDDEVVIYVTGKIKPKQQPLFQLAPTNLVLTDYLPEEDYIQFLHSVDVVIDLTTREDCLVCGAYEAVAAGKPLIISDTKALREVFNKGVLYTNNTAKDLASKIQHAIHNKEKLQHDMLELRASHVRNRLHQQEGFEKLLTNVGHHGAKSVGI